MSISKRILAFAAALTLSLSFTACSEHLSVANAEAPTESAGETGRMNNI